MILRRVRRGDGLEHVAHHPVRILAHHLAPREPAGRLTFSQWLADQDGHGG